MAKSISDFEVTKEKIKQTPTIDENFIIMKKGYKEIWRFLIFILK